MMVVVAGDGSGDYTSLQAAIDAVQGGSRAPDVVLVKAGIYRERVVVNKSNLRIVGEDRDTTVLTYSACAKDPDENGEERGTFLSFTLIVTGDQVEVENLTIRNDAGDGRQVGQAVAVYAAGDRGIWRNCRMIAHQDTLFCGPTMPKVEDFIAPRGGVSECVPSVGDSPLTRGRQYFEKCWIAGDVDFIFGPYRCWFEECTLWMNVRGGWYTAANTPREQPYGMVFHRCSLTGECEEGAAKLGRPWRKYARTLFLACDMDACVSPQGFEDWNEERKITDRCGEYGTMGVRADQTPRHPKQKRMTDAENSAVNIPEVLGGYDQWRPDRPAVTWYLCGDSTMADYGPERYPMMGWGQKLPGLLEEPVFVQNCAVNGRSSKSFIDEKRLEHIAWCLRPGDKLIISFSHNDEKADPLRGTTPDGTFPAYLTRYVETALTHQAEPILATPIARRYFDQQGVLQPTHGAYPAAIRRLAKERGLRLADLEKGTMDLFRQAGVEGTKEIFCFLPHGTENYPEGAADNSHLQEKGAACVAGLFLRLLKEAGKEDRDQTEKADSAADLSFLLDQEDSILK